MIWLDSVAGNFRAAQGAAGKANGVVMAVLIFAHAGVAVAHVAGCQHALRECEDGAAGGVVVVVGRGDFEGWGS